MSEVPVFITARLVRAVGVLALDPQGQLDWIDTLGLPDNLDSVDELAMEYGEACHFLPGLIDSGLIPARCEWALREIDAELTSMSGPVNDALWDRAALREGTRWSKVRVLARKVLALI